VSTVSSVCGDFGGCNVCWDNLLVLGLAEQFAGCSFAPVLLVSIVDECACVLTRLCSVCGRLSELLSSCM
jgi:hypothetical protein